MMIVVLLLLFCGALYGLERMLCEFTHMLSNSKKVKR